MPTRCDTIEKKLPRKRWTGYGTTRDAAFLMLSTRVLKAAERAGFSCDGGSGCEEGDVCIPYVDLAFDTVKYYATIIRPPGQVPRTGFRASWTGEVKCKCVCETPIRRDEGEEENEDKGGKKGRR